jgi:hypothetical protein
VKACSPPFRRFLVVFAELPDQEQFYLTGGTRRTFQKLALDLMSELTGQGQTGPRTG